MSIKSVIAFALEGVDEAEWSQLMDELKEYLRPRLAEYGPYHLQMTVLAEGQSWPALIHSDGNSLRRPVH